VPLQGLQDLAVSLHGLSSAFTHHAQGLKDLAVYKDLVVPFQGLKALAVPLQGLSSVVQGLSIEKLQGSMLLRCN